MIQRTVCSIHGVNASPPPIETFRFIGPTYFSVKYYFNSNYNRSNSLLITNERTPYFIEFLVDLANNGGTLNFVLVNNLALNPSYGASDSMSGGRTLFKQNSTLNERQVEYSMQNNVNNNNRIKEMNLADVDVYLHVCLMYNSMSTYKNCPDGYKLVTQSYTNIFTTLQMNVAYPMMGKWYMAVWKECTDSKTKYRLIKKLYIGSLFQIRHIKMYALKPSILEPLLGLCNKSAEMKPVKI
jgi:hypothetical protein